MKKNIKILSIIVCLIMVATVAFALVGCKNDDTPQVIPEGVEVTSTGKTPGTAGTLTLIVAGANENEPASEYIVAWSSVFDGKVGLDVLDYFKATSNLTYTASESQYGAFVTSVNNLVANDDAHTFISFYTSVQSDFADAAWATTKTYKGITLTSAAVGFSSASIKDGAILYVELGSY